MVTYSDRPIYYRPKLVATLAERSSTIVAEAVLSPGVTVRHPLGPANFSVNETYLAYRTLARHLLVRTCGYCGTELEVRAREGVLANSYSGITVRACRRCGWWTEANASIVLGFSDSSPSDFVYWSGSMSEGSLEVFDTGAADVPARALAEHISANPDALYLTHPRSFERLVAGVYGEVFNCEALLTGQSHDGGVDVILIRGDGVRQLIEVKRRTKRSKTEGVRTVRELAGVLVSEGHRHGIVVSTAGHFSDAASLAASRYVERGYTINLVGVDEFLHLMDIAESQWLDEPDCFELMSGREIQNTNLWRSCPKGLRDLLRSDAVEIECEDWPQE